MTDDRYLCRTAFSMKKIANVLRKSQVTDLTEAETLEDAWKLWFLVQAHIAVALARTN
jgi:hypothetical protein